ncbi:MULTISPECIES: hypothetical protein [unclassified Haladaptatus]|uniref:hypothetical protein n=1 Tax=unclassified Haladaptatus TaxID=2622732 RepID=UPI00209C1B02|nr:MULTISPECIES: hypothetical protein [unclassified Haladaptatus]MCO8245442.1 hypothetical protein [Haladaptatus sp. AB643]MCO8256553.1 hypothetical protein [Haladaptatus sp. AB618]
MTTQVPSNYQPTFATKLISGFYLSLISYATISILVSVYYVIGGAGQFQTSPIMAFIGLIILSSIIIPFIYGYMNIKRSISTPEEESNTRQQDLFFIAGFILVFLVIAIVASQLFKPDFSTWPLIYATSHFLALSISYTISKILIT